jgi:hypothetical protein
MKPYDFKKGNLMRSYTTAKGTKFIAGDGHSPSPIRILKNSSEVAALRQEPQFEILELDSIEELHELVQTEMEERVYEGRAPVRAKIEGVKPEAAKKAAIDKITKPGVDDDENDEDAGPSPALKPQSTKKTGRKPTPSKKETSKKKVGKKKASKKKAAKK